MAYLPGLYFLKKYPMEQLWRLFVDGRFWSKQNGWEGYEEREKGSLSAGLESLMLFSLQANDTKNFTITVELIKSIHARCGKNVEELQEKNPGNLRVNEPVSFAIPANRASENGVIEFLKINFLQKYACFGSGEMGVFAPKIPINKLEYVRENPYKIEVIGKQIYKKMLLDGYSESTHFYIAPLENVEHILRKLTRSYNKDIKKAKTLDDKVYVIAKHIKLFELLHPFRDANGRTFVNILMNIMLMQQGLPPATFYEPNVFDLYSTEELAVVIKEAMFNTLTIIYADNNKPISLYGYTKGKEQTKFIDIFESQSHKQLQNRTFSIEKIENNDKEVTLYFSSMNKYYPLHFAAVYNDDSKLLAELINKEIKSINKIIKAGATPLYVGRTPLHVAAIVNNKAMFDELIKHRANVINQDYDGKTILHYIAEYAHDRLLENMPLLDHLDFVNIQDNDGKTALHYAVETGNAILVKKLIIDDPNYINIKDRMGKAALHYAAQHGNKDIALLLLENNANVNLVDDLGFTPVSIACENKKDIMFETLLNSGCHICTNTLSFIVQNNNVKAFNSIIKKDNKILLNKEAFGCAINLGDLELVNKFLDAGMDINLKIDNNLCTPIMMAVTSKHIKLIKFFIKNNSDVTLVDKDNNNLFYYAAVTANFDLIKQVLKFKGSKELIYDLNKFGKSAIYVLAGGSKELVMLLIKLGDDFKKTICQEDNTVLHVAMAGRNMDSIKELLKINPTLANIKNNKGQTPLQYALKSTLSKFYQEEFMDVIKILIKKNIDISGKDNQGNSIIDYVLSKGCLTLFLQLEQLGIGTRPNISNASIYLSSQKHELITSNILQFEYNLLQNLSDNPIIAAFQLNELYEKVKDGTITTPENYQKPKEFSIFNKEKNVVKAHTQVLKVLEKSYLSIILKIPEHLQKDVQGHLDENKFFAKHLNIYLAKHKLSHKLASSLKRNLQSQCIKVLKPPVQNKFSSQFIP
ncbi:MAG: ankyrin repeat domain-containing protein [Legionella longbeachae]|nr:ankyrin repeat domain-containing protein [Legionella longbeachae]